MENINQILLNAVLLIFVFILVKVMMMMIDRNKPATLVALFTLAKRREPTFEHYVKGISDRINFRITNDIGDIPHKDYVEYMYSKGYELGTDIEKMTIGEVLKHYNEQHKNYVDSM